MKDKKEIPEYNFAQLNLLILALQMLDTSIYDTSYKETHKHLLERFKTLKEKHKLNYIIIK